MSTGMKGQHIRNLGVQVTHMQWNSKIDLLAVATVKSEVIILRFHSLQKLFTFPPPICHDDQHKTMQLTCMSWHVSEPLLTVGYDTGTIFILDVEKQAPQHCCCVKQKPVSIRCTEIEENVVFTDNHYRPKYEKVEIPFENFLPSFDKLYTVDQHISRGIDSYQQLTDSISPIFMVVSCEDSISLIILGALRAGTIELKSHITQPFEVLDARLTSANNSLIVLIQEGAVYKTLIFDNEFLRDYMAPLINIAKKQRLIEVTIKFLSTIVDNVLEAFDTVSMEVDHKLTASNLNTDKAYGNLSADLLELLLFGASTPELDRFLLSGLTQKGIKKLSQSTEMGYRCIQNIVGNPVQQTGINLFYLLNTLRGPKSNYYFYGDLLVPTVIDSALSKCVGFIMKAIEVQLVVDSAAMDMKIFWSWLSSAFISLTEESISDDGNYLTQEDRINLVEILSNIEDYFSLKANGNGRSRFSMEKIGQYLKNENLKVSYTADLTENNTWLTFLEENKCLELCPQIYIPAKSQSLLQVLAELKETVLTIFKNTETVLSKSFSLQNTIALGAGIRNDLHLSFYTMSSNMLTVALNKKEFMIVRILSELDRCNFAIVSLECPVFGAFKHSDLSLIDIKFYNEETLSICLSAKENVRQQIYFLQFPLDLLKHKWIPRQFKGNLNLSSELGNSAATAYLLDLTDLDKATKIEHDSVAIDVSCTRKVAAVLSDNRKRIKVYEMEVIDDDSEYKNVTL